MTQSPDHPPPGHGQLHPALAAASLGTWEMDLVRNRRIWSDITCAMHGLPPEAAESGHIEINDQLMHPDDRVRLRELHDALRAGRDDYAFEYRASLPDGSESWILARGKVVERTPEGPTRIIGICLDITAQKQAQLLQERVDAQFRLLADALPQLVWMADEDGRTSYYNKRRSAYGFDDANAPSGRPWMTVIHPDDLGHTLAAWQEAMSGGRSYEIEHRLRMADGSYRWHLSRATPVRAGLGKITWFGTATDIDRLKQADARVQGGVERLKLATAAASMFAWELDFENNTLGWDENAPAVIGCAPEELSSDPAVGAHFVHPDDRGRIAAEFEQAWKSGGDHFESEFRGRDRQGKPVYWRATGKFLRREGKLRPVRAVAVTQDVTRHVEAAAQLRVLDERLAAAELGAGALVYDSDLATDRVWRSQGITRILGWSPDEVAPTADAWAQLIHPEDRARFEQTSAQEKLRPDDHYSHEYRVRHKDGSYRWVMDSGRVFRDAQGRIARYAGTTIDITERKRAEMAQTRMAGLIDLSFEPILVWHRERGILEWNAGAEMLYGFTRGEALGKLPQALLQTQYGVPPGQVLRQLAEHGRWSGEVLNTGKDGNSIVVESRYQDINIGGESVVLETNRDIRERKRAEASRARMAAVAEASHDALYGATLDGQIEAWNPGAERLLGYTEAEAIGRHVSILAHPGQHAEQVLFLQQVASGKTVKPFDTVRMTKDGRLIDVSIAMSPVRSANGEVIAVSVALHDISERKDWEKRQLLMNRELAHRVKNSFAVLQAILRSTLRSAPSPEHFAAAFSGRLHSMAVAHDVLTANDWRGAELGALLRLQLAQYVQSDRVELSGAPLNLPAAQAAPLSLIINELATNALKHGALANSRGHIAVSWAVSRNGGEKPHVMLTWRERGGPSAASPGPRGFGSTLIEKGFADAAVTMDFAPEGLTCTLRWPLDGE